MSDTRDWVEEQFKCEYMRGPWIVEEDLDYPEPEIRVVYKGVGITITIGRWPMEGARKGSPAYYMALAHAKKLASVPELEAQITRSNDFKE